MRELIRGVQKTSLVDYPGQICTTLFIGGCNLRCPWCHNSDLVLRPRELPRFQPKAILSSLEKRKHLVPAVCITGGEPTLWAQLPSFIGDLKARGFKVKLDTNGTHPEVLQALLAQQLLDYVAMDVKAPPQKYALLTGRSAPGEAKAAQPAEVGEPTPAAPAQAGEPADCLCLGQDAQGTGENVLGRVQQSIDLIKSSSIDYEFRTTAVPERLEEQDLLAIGSWLAQPPRPRRWVLQQFRPTASIIDPCLREARPYPPEILERVAAQMAPYFEEVKVRS